MRTYGLIGYPLSHSQSPEIFQKIFNREGVKNVEYNLYPLEDIHSIRSLVRANDLHGFSVTIPHKTSVIQYLDDMNDDAKAIGAVNAVKVIRVKGKLFLKGYNTDAPAFLETLKPLLITTDVRALVLGRGGASRAVCHALEILNIPYIIVTRRPEKAGQINYDVLNEEAVKNHLLIINTTPLGMFPNVGSYPDLPYESLTKQHIVYDLIYNPGETLFLQKARHSGAVVKNGWEMLQQQAELAWKIWGEE